MANENSRLLTNSTEYRECSLAKNSKGYTTGNQYCAGSPDTISDGDDRGRDPQNVGSSIGTATDIKLRECSLAKNSDGYTTGNQYCVGNPDTISDGDIRGREPENTGMEAGTCLDIKLRSCSLSKNSNLYTKNHQYGFGNGMA